MNPNDSPLLPGPWPDVLAAYADGELDPAARAIVASWLAAHPKACEQVQAQRQLSPENWPLWQQADPPLPSETAWNSVRAAVLATIEAPTMPVQPVSRSWLRYSGMYFAGGVAAAVAVCLLLSSAKVVSPLADAPLPDSYFADPLAEFAVLPLAADGDVEIERVAGNGSGWLPIGDTPLGDTLALVGEDDVKVEEAEPHPAWPGGSPKMTTARGDVPMIFAARAR